MVPTPVAPSGRAGTVAGGAVRCGCAGRRSSSSVAQAHHRSASVGFGRSRSERIGRPSGGHARAAGQGTAAVGSSQAKPSSSRAVVVVRHEVEELERLEGQEPVGDAGRDDDPVVGAELAGLDDRRGRPGRRARAGRRRARRTPGRRRRPSSRAGGGGSAGRGARRRAEVDRLAWTNVGAVAGLRAGVAGVDRAERRRRATARGTSRARRRSGRPRRSGRRAGRDGGRSRLIASCRAAAARARGPGRSRPSPPATAGAARRTAVGSARGRPSAAASTAGARSAAGTSLDLDRPGRTGARMSLGPVGPRRDAAVDDVVDAARARPRRAARRSRRRRRAV